MKLYQDWNLKIEYNNRENILCVQFQEPIVYSFTAFEESFLKMMEIIEDFGVKKILFKSNKTIVSLPQEQQIKISELVCSGLAHSKIEKMARTFVNNSLTEAAFINQIHEVLDAMNLDIKFQNFANKKSALLWLRYD